MTTVGAAQGISGQVADVSHEVTRQCHPGAVRRSHLVTTNQRLLTGVLLRGTEADAGCHAVSWGTCLMPSLKKNPHCFA